MQMAHKHEQSFLEQSALKQRIAKKLRRSIVIGSIGMSFMLILALTNVFGSFKWAALSLSLLLFAFLTISPIVRIIRTFMTEDNSVKQFYESEISAKTNIANMRGFLQAYVEQHETENSNTSPTTLH